MHADVFCTRQAKICSTMDDAKRLKFANNFAKFVFPL